MCKTIKLKNKGFTLMELMVVLGVLGVLASMVGPGSFNYFKKQRTKESAEKIQILINEGFSSARSQAKSFKLSAIVDSQTPPINADKLVLSSCDKIDCSGTNVIVATEKLAIDVRIKNGNFDFIFTAPYGHILDPNSIFTEDYNNDANNEELIIKIENKYKYQVIVHKLSGLNYIKSSN